MKIEQQSSELQRVRYIFSDADIKKALIDLIRGNPYMGQWIMEWDNGAEDCVGPTIVLLHIVDVNEGEPKEWIEMSEEERRVLAGFGEKKI